MAGISFLDLLFAEALASGMAREARTRERPPPDNFFVLPRDPRAWRQIQVACKKENMVIGVDVTSDGCERMQQLFVELAREHDGMPFLRVKIGGGLGGGTYDELRSDLGGIRYTPTFVFVFFSENGIQRAKYEGTSEVQQGVQGGTMRGVIRELQKRRVQLKMAENLAEELASHVKDSIEERESKLRREYEEKLRKQMEEKDRALRLEEEQKKKKEEEKKKQEQEDAQELEQKKRRVAKQRAEARPQYLAELLAMDLDAVPIRDVKAIMIKLGVSHHDCFERKDLKKKLVENVPELRRKLENDERRESTSSVGSFVFSPTSSVHSMGSHTDSFSENQMSERERADKLEKEKKELERELDRRTHELDRAQDDLRRMTTRANVAETKFLEMSAQQSSSKSYSKPTAEKDVLISSVFEQRPTPKPRSGSGDGVIQAQMKELQTQLLETRLLYTTTIEDYDVLGLIHDSGEEGIVLRAQCKKKGLPNPERVYAMKVLTNYFQSQTTTQARAQFQNEYEILCQVPPHENVIHMYAFFFDRANPDISPEFKRVGKNLRTMSLFLLMDEHPMSMKEQLEILTQGKGPQPAKVIQWAKDLISGLAFLQSNQVVHRDLKLDNLLMDEKGRIIISDFGKAVVLDETMKVAFNHGYSTGGNNAHLAPEVLNAKPGPRRFINYTKQPVWAAGVLVYELAGHQNPFQSGTIDQRGYSIDALPPLKYTYCTHSKFCQPLNSKLTALVRDMLQMEPTDRPSLQDCVKRVMQISA